MTSLQKEDFFDLLATSQGRRLDDQRAELQDVPSAPPPLLPKAKQRKSSWKIPEVTRAVPTQTPKEDFYNMIVNSQVSAAAYTYDLTGMFVFVSGNVLFLFASFT